MRRCLKSARPIFHISKIIENGKFVEHFLDGNSSIGLQVEQYPDRDAASKDPRTPYRPPVNEWFTYYFKQTRKPRYPHDVANQIIAWPNITYRRPTSLIETCDVATVIQKFVPGFDCEYSEP